MGCFDKARGMIGQYGDGTQQVVVIGGHRNIDDIYNDAGEVIGRNAVVVHVF